jgi:hypothetical protein
MWSTSVFVTRICASATSTMPLCRPLPVLWVADDDDEAAAAAAVGSRPMGKAERRQAEREARSRAKQAGRRRARAKFRRRPPAGCRTVCSTALKAGSLRKKLASLENCEYHHRPRPVCGRACFLEGGDQAGLSRCVARVNGCVTVV